MRGVMDNRLFAGLFGVMLMMGIALTLFGATLPLLIRTFGWSYLESGLVMGAGSVSFFIATFFAGRIASTVGLSRLFRGGFVLAAGGLLLFARWPSMWVNVFVNALMSLGFGAVEIGANLTMLQLEKDGSGRAMNVLHAAFAIGAILGPVATGALLQAGIPWNLVYRGMAVLFLVLWMVMERLNPSRFDIPRADHDIHPREALIREPVYWLGFLTLCLYVGAELGVSNWVAEYGVQVFRIPERYAVFLVSTFWVGLLAGRFLAPLVLTPTRQRRVLLGSAVLFAAAVALTALLGMVLPSPLLLVVLVLASGLGAAVIFPTTVSLVGTALARWQGDAVGFATTGGGVGSFVFPFVMSAISEAWGIRIGFAFYSVSAFLLLGSLGLLIAAAAHRAGRGKG
ncbi:major facilitator superfamily MFS_1 [Spirochaeta thermophila DSM 6578]|uniref:Major facilitator superfamily MFS_1 n=2 Tax=Winmispira thermophila TaxID=154 RepID=G0GFB6_WINT7|nr:major facilitator superfamily MFS_1 [Spirochaeta thermophila DSM 6578]